MINKLQQLVLLLIVMGVCISSQAAVLPGVYTADEPDQTVSVPIGLASEQVGEFVAPLNEVQVRQLLIDKLAIEAAEKNATQQVETVSVIEMLKGVRNPYTPLGRAVSATANSASSYFPSVNDIINKLTAGAGWSGLFLLLGVLLTVTLLAYGVEYLCLMRPRKWQLNQNGDDEKTFRRLVGQPLLVVLMNFCGLIIFTIAGYVIAAFFKPEDSGEYQLMMQMFDWIISIRFFALLFKFLLKPAPIGLGVIDEEVNSKKLYDCMVVFTIIYICGSGIIELLGANGLVYEHIVLSTIVLAGLLLNPIVLWFVWTERYEIDRSLFGEVNEGICKINGYRYAARAATWPSVVTFVLTFGFFNWLIQLLLNNEQGIKTISIVWWITLLFPVIDLVVTSLLNSLVSLELFQHKRFQQRKQRFIFIIRSVVRLVLITVMVLSMLRAWGFDVIAEYRIIGDRDIVHTLIDIGAVILIGYIIWEVIQLWMERKLPDDEPEDGVVEIEGEGGGAAATRTETLLPLFKTTLLIVLFLMVVMSILYSLGIQIGPLLAGAGVVGIAVGFGSQKLVQDIISGVFFLIDDAFRKGEYVEVAGMRGTVEKLSVRSMRLRHHLGAVQTIPYGEIATVRNQSRDWVIMKLELRLPYDVDIEKVRKIIKKVGQEMLADEEIGPNMLQPLKSQGVMRVEESALIIRMKFTAKPGEQWIVRRVAYTKVRDALAAAGIEFAHREVKVRLPQELEHLQKMDYERKLHLETDADHAQIKPVEADTTPAALAAAAMSAVVAKELAANEKIDQDNDEDGDR